MGDLKNPNWIYLKGGLFLIILIVSAALIILEAQKWSTIFLVLLLIWSAARLYYFMFYVIEKYIDPSFKFSGITDFVRYLISGGKK